MFFHWFAPFYGLLDVAQRHRDERGAFVRSLSAVGVRSLAHLNSAELAEDVVADGAEEAFPVGGREAHVDAEEVAAEDEGDVFLSDLATDSCYCRREREEVVVVSEVADFALLFFALLSFGFLACLFRTSGLLVGHRGHEMGVAGGQSWVLYLEIVVQLIDAVAQFAGRSRNVLGFFGAFLGLLNILAIASPAGRGVLVIADFYDLRVGVK